MQAEPNIFIPDKEPELKKHMDSFMDLDMVFFGIVSSTPELHISFYSSYLTKEECREMLKKQSVRRGVFRAARHKR
jgi:hypothetical protein